MGKGQVIDGRTASIQIDRIRRDKKPTMSIPRGIPILHIRARRCMKLLKRQSLEWRMRVQPCNGSSEKYKNQLIYFPAAKKNHHSVRCGLLYHITTMLKMPRRFLKLTTFSTRTFVCRSILHDIGKIEMEVSNTALFRTIQLKG